jgi:hypothetical protein
MSLLRGWGVVGFVLAAALWLAPGEARAFPDEPYSLDEGTNAHSKRFQILGELALFGGNIEGNARAVLVSPLFELRFQLAEHWLLDAAWGFSYVNLNPDRDNDETDNSFRPGNPWVAFHYQGVKGQFSYRFGFGVTIPVASLPDPITTPDQVTATAAYALAAAVRGNTMYWLWDPHSVSVVFPLAFERRKPSGFLWGADFAAGVMLQCCGSKSDRNPNQRNDAVIQMGAMMGYQAVEWLRVGSRFTLVVLPKIPQQKTQLAVEPFLRFGSDNAFGSVGVVINLDNPWGFAFDSDQVWGLRIAGGASF